MQRGRGRPHPTPWSARRRGVSSQLAARVALALLCVTLACKSGSGAAEPVLKDTPFVTLGSADFGVHPQLGIEVGARHLLVFFREDAAATRERGSSGGEIKPGIVDARRRSL